MSQKRSVNVEREIKFVVDPQQAELIKDRIESGEFGVIVESKMVSIVDKYFKTDDEFKRIRIRSTEGKCFLEVKRITSMDNGDKTSVETSVVVDSAGSATEVLLEMGLELRNVVNKSRIIYNTNTLQISVDYIENEYRVSVEFEIIGPSESPDDLFQFIRDVMKNIQ
jgi:predicted adenylyl cyclase CyaB